MNQCAMYIFVHNLENLENCEESCSHTGCPRKNASIALFTLQIGRAHGLNSSLHSLPPSLLSLPPSLYFSFYLSFSLFPSLSLLFIILFGVSNGRFRPCLYKNKNKPGVIDFLPMYALVIYKVR